MPDDTSARLVDLMIAAARLKSLPRTGWLMRGVDVPESVAAHSHGTALATLVLLDLVEDPLDRARALAMAVLHDLPEAITGDIPAPAVRRLGEAARSSAEAAILEELVAETPVAGSWRDLWREYAAGESPEARLVRDADKLDMFLQSVIYLRSGHTEVARFWERVDAYPWTYPASRDLLAVLAEERPSI